MVAVKVREQDGVDEQRVHAETLHRDEGRSTTVDEQVRRFRPDVEAGLETTPTPESVSASQNLYTNLCHTYSPHITWYGPRGQRAIEVDLSRARVNTKMNRSCRDRHTPEFALVQKPRPDMCDKATQVRIMRTDSRAYHPTFATDGSARRTLSCLI